jgi:hypothetical protein
VPINEDRKDSATNFELNPFKVSTKDVFIFDVDKASRATNLGSLWNVDIEREFQLLMINVLSKCNFFGRNKRRGFEKVSTFGSSQMFCRNSEQSHFQLAQEQAWAKISLQDGGVSEVNSIEPWFSAIRESSFPTDRLVGGVDFTNASAGNCFISATAIKCRN